MSVLAGIATGVLVQGVTGRQASWSTADMLAYGTRVLGGVVPGRAGGRHLDLPLFDSVGDAVLSTGAEASIVFVPPPAAAGAIVEAIEAGVRLVVYPGDGFPVHDALRVRRRALAAKATLVGPNTPGLISPGSCKLGFMPGYCYRPGGLAVISKSGSLSYEVCWRLSEAGIGQSTVVGIGGDPVKGLRLGEALEVFHEDGETQAVFVLGEIGGLDEYEVCAYVARPDAKPVGAFIVGRTAPRGRKLGHAGALIGSDREGYQPKVAALEAAGVPVAATIAETVKVAARLIGGGVL